MGVIAWLRDHKDKGILYRSDKNAVPVGYYDAAHGAMFTNLPTVRNSAKAVAAPSLPPLVHECCERVNLRRRPVVHSVFLSHTTLIFRKAALSLVDILRICNDIVCARTSRFGCTRIGP